MERIEGCMVKNIPENAVSRVETDEGQFRADGRRSSGALPRSMEAFAAGFGASFGSSTRSNGHPTNGHSAFEDEGPTICNRGDTVRTRRGVDFGDAIGKELQALYDDLVAQPVPDRFLNLLNQLENNMVSSGLSDSAPGERE
jgi:hypothetical protein